MIKKEEQLEKELSKTAEAAIKSLGKKNATVGVFFLPSGEMSTLKYKYLGKRRKFVDVLAFPEPEGFPTPKARKKFLGEIYLNRLLLRGERERLFHLLFHGVLHILGFSHEGRRETAGEKAALFRLAKTAD